MKIIDVSPSREISVQPFVASQGQEMLVDLAVGSFGHLLRTRGPKAFSLTEFADIIARHYDVRDNARNYAVVDALRTAQEQTEAMALRSQRVPAEA